MIIMKKYILIFLFFLLQSCQNPKDIVFWCGDHACKNEKERSAYFEKTMLVEIRKIDVKKCLFGIVYKVLSGIKNA